MRRLLISAAVVVVLVAGYAVADAEDIVPGVLTLSPASTTAGTGSGAGSGGASSTPAASGWPATLPVRPVLGTPAPAAPLPTPAVLGARLSATLRAFGAGGSGLVVDVATGRTLYSRSASTPRTPASTTKLLTAVSVLSTLGPEATLTTKVVHGAKPGQIVLVGGGDIRLATGAGSPTAVFGRAGLGDLAAATAAALRTAGTTKVTLAFDDTMFSGPRLSSHWVRSDSGTGEAGPVTDLGLAAKAPTPGHPAPADPSLAAAQAFATELVRAGIGVSGKPVRARAPSGMAPLAAVQSAPVGDILSVTLDTSDNTEAEVLARLAAHAAGRPGSFVGAAAQDVAAAVTLGVPVTGVRLYDGSGLSRANLIPARTLALLLQKAATSPQTGLRVLFGGLPVAGLTGTLAPRFADAKTRAGAGLIRAKTGTLLGVNTLAGITVDADGRLLAFAFMANHPTANTPPARPVLDRAAALLATCGCH